MSYLSVSEMHGPGLWTGAYSDHHQLRCFGLGFKDDLEGGPELGGY
jgi:hypothetical protein